MSLKQQIHALVDELPDDSPLLIEVRETLRLNQAIGVAMDDVREGRTYSAEEFMAKVQQRWPRKSSPETAQGDALGALLQPVQSRRRKAELVG